MILIKYKCSSKKVAVLVTTHIPYSYLESSVLNNFKLDIAHPGSEMSL
jgi:hypothetical protein